MFRKINLLLALVLAFVMLCFASMPAAMADEGDENGPGNAAETDKAAITKLLKVPYGTSFPEGGFTFKFLIELTSEDGEAPKGNAPIIGEKYNDPESGEPVPNTGYVEINLTSGDYPTTHGNLNYYYLESQSIFDSTEWPHAGIYEYRITEEPNTLPPAINAHLTYSKAEYTLYVYLDTDGEGGYEITHIGAVMTRTDADVEVENATKVDPTPGSSSEGPYSEMVFTNEYWNVTGPDPDTDPGPDPEFDATLYVSKTVDGFYANAETYFTFDVTITAPDLSGVPESYKAYIIDGNAELPSYVTAEDMKDPEKNNVGAGLVSGAPDAYGDYITFASGAPLTLNLKHGERLVFVGTPVGTSYEVTERAVANYAPGVFVMYSSEASEHNIVTPNTPLAIPNAEFSSANGLMLVGEGENYAAFTNTRDAVTPTGLNLNDLPFIGMIALGLGALIVFVAVKSRSKKHNN